MSYRLSYLENFHFSNFQHPASEAANKFENVDLEALLKIQKDIAELEPDIGKNFVTIADTCIKLKRYSGSSDSN
jgi:hypothetical protein